MSLLDRIADYLNRRSARRYAVTLSRRSSGGRT